MLVRLTIVVALFGLVACSDGTAVTTSETTSTTVETTTTFANPFLDVIDVDSNFDPGEPIVVVGLPATDPAWVGSFPASDVEFFGRLWEFDRVAPGLVAVGEAASYQDGAVWERVEMAGQEFPGFFPQAQTGVIGGIEDVTADVSDLEAPSADELLDLMAATLAQPEGLEPIRITIREFGGREVYYDLIKASDSENRGYRVRVVVEETADSTFTVVAAERWILCVSGVDETGACV